MTEEQEVKKNLSRREFLKVSGVASAAMSLAGAALAGLGAGKDYDTYTGWEDIFEGGAQFFNRKPYEVDSPTYEVVGKTRRPDTRVEGRGHYRALESALEDGWTKEDGIDALPDYLADYYKEHPEALDMALYRINVLEPLQDENQKKYGMRWALAMAWSSGYRATRPARPDSSPEEWDFRDMREKPLAFKSPEHASKLIKKVAHTYGATLVGIAKLNPDWVYQHDIRGGEPGPYEVPEWWKYAIVVTTPHEWGQMRANPTYGTSSDAYNRSSLAGGRLAAFIRELGYPARLHSPDNRYDLLVPPICVDAGLAEQGRHLITITPELGTNHRPAVITTNMPMKVDKPIDFGVQEFCKECKICADNCPGNAIPTEDDSREVVRGYKRWQIDVNACYNFWGVALGNGGCRTCLAVCPYSRRSSWVHDVARKVSAADPTGLIDTPLIWMQEQFFGGPEKEAYYPPNHPDGDGRNASYRPAPDWMKTEKWFDVKVTW